MQKLIAAIAAGLALAATSGAAQAQISDDVVKIGVLTDMSSLYADATGKGSLAAVEMAVADYGAKVAGKPVQVVSADHQNKPDVGVNIARNWYDNDKVDAIFDVPTSSVALPISALTREKNKIHINSGGGSSDITGVACSSSRRAAARCSARSAIRSTRRTSPPSCSRPRPPRPRWSHWPMPAATPPMR
jgi:branched-chain amino acid transport system substrate-binding protein